MGTRNLTCVFMDGEYRVAQYGQWDGYPGGQGKTILEFLRDEENIKNLKNNLDKTRFFDQKGKDKKFLDEYDKNAPEWSSDPDNRTPEQKRWFSQFITRDLGGEILLKIANSTDAEILLKNSIDFAGDSLFCEFAYVVDFDKNTFEVYSGFNTSPLEKTSRFAEIKPEKGSEYYPVQLMHSFDIDNLPIDEEFLQILEPEEEVE